MIVRNPNSVRGRRPPSDYRFRYSLVCDRRGMIIAIAKRTGDLIVTPTGDGVMLVGPDGQLGKLEGKDAWQICPWQRKVKSRGV